MLSSNTFRLVDVLTCGVSRNFNSSACCVLRLRRHTLTFLQVILFSATEPNVWRFNICSPTTGRLRALEISSLIQLRLLPHLTNTYQSGFAGGSLSLLSQSATKRWSSYCLRCAVIRLEPCQLQAISFDCFSLTADFKQFYGVCLHFYCTLFSVLYSSVQSLPP